MNATERRSCYGGMFPDPPMTKDRLDAGKVFTLVTEAPVGMCRGRPQLEVNRAAWDECVQCPDFDHCYKLSMARIAMRTLANGI